MKTTALLSSIGLMVAFSICGGCGGDGSPKIYNVTYTASVTGANSLYQIAWDDGKGGVQTTTNAAPNWSLTFTALPGASIGVKATAVSTECTIVVTAKADDGKGDIVDRSNTQTGRSNTPQAWTSETDHPSLP